MKSTETIHEIIEKHGCADNRELMKDLLKLRNEILGEFTGATNNAIVMMGIRYKA